MTPLEYAQARQAECGEYIRSGGADQRGALRSTLPEYKVWCGMKKRCSNPRCKSYPMYGGRGIAVCAEWTSNFWEFYNHVGPRPSPTYQIERINNMRGYEPGNVRWATGVEQQRNKRNNRRIEFHGETRTSSEWASIVGIPYRTILTRLCAGWSTERTLSEPSGAFSGRFNKANSRTACFRGQTKTLTEWSQSTGLEFHVIRYRLNAGWDVDSALSVPKQKYERSGLSL